LTLWFINRFFYPDESATSQLLLDLTQGLSGEYSISVVCSTHSLTAAAKTLPRKEQLGRISIHRLGGTRWGNSSLLGKAVDLLTFQLAVLWFVLRKVHSGDLVVLKTDPPLLQIATTGLIKIKGAKIVNWLQDIYPEIAIRLEQFPGPGWLADSLCRLRDRALHRAEVNVVISARMAEFLRKRGVTNTRVIANWADSGLYAENTHAVDMLKEQWGLAGKFVVMYSGNFGRVHDFKDIAEAVKELATVDNIHFVFIGAGAEKERLQKALERSGSANYSFKPFQPRSLLAQSLAVADLHLVSLKAGMEDLVMPSKLCGVLAAGRPVGFLGEPGSDIARFIEQEQVGFALDIGRGLFLARRIRELSMDPGKQNEWARNARAVFEKTYSKQQAIAAWERVLTPYSSLN
jgi:glycosyltransferase involved in cell wall biosynthesis